MDEIRVGKIEVVNVNANEKEFFEDSIREVITGILKQHPQAEVLYVISISTGDNNDMGCFLKNAQNLKSMFEAHNIYNTVFIPDSEVKISEVKVIHEYPKENK